MNYVMCHLKKALLVTGVIALISPIAIMSAVAQTEQPAATEGGAGQTGESVATSETNRQIILGEQSVDGDFEITESNVDIVVGGGMHAISGNVQINGSGDRVIIEFDEKEGAGRVEIAGALILGPDNAPLLGIDLSKVNLRKGARFVIADASQIIGEFGGITNGTFTVGGYTLRIIYSATSIAIVVIDEPDRWRPFIMPVTMIDSDLINPTSTSPSSL